MEKLFQKAQLSAFILAGVLTVFSDAATSWSNGKSAGAWRDVAGTHYAQQFRSGNQPIYNWIRGINGTVNRSSSDRDVTGLLPSQRPADVKKVIGIFSGEERFYDFGSPTRTGSYTYDILQNTQTGATGFTTFTPGGSEWGGSASAWDLVKSNDSKYFKDLIYNIVYHLNTGIFSSSPIRYFEIGNEVNAVGQFNPRLLPLPLTGTDIYSDDTIQARMYVEYFYGPAVEAVRKASWDIYGDSKRCKVMLGGIAGMYSKSSHDFIDTVMNRRINAIRAPALANRQVKTCVDIMALHYEMRFPIKSEKIPWDVTLESMYTKWYQPGYVKSVWGTEELGDHGKGALDVLVTGFRYLHFWSQKGWKPDVMKFFMYGEKDRTDFLNVQYRLLDIWSNGMLPLVELSKHLTIDTANGLEGYALANEDPSDLRCALVCFGKHLYEQPGPPISTITLHDVPTSISRPAKLDIEASIVNGSTETLNGPPMQSVTINALYDSIAGKFTLTFPQNVVLADSQILFVTIRPKSTTSIAIRNTNAILSNKQAIVRKYCATGRPTPMGQVFDLRGSRIETFKNSKKTSNKALPPKMFIIVDD